MKNFLKKIHMFFLPCLALLICITSHIDAYALSSRIAFTDLSTQTGQSFSINMKVSSLDSGKLGNVNIMLKYDPAYIEFTDGTNAEGGAGSIRVNGATSEGDTSYTYKLNFKALAAGETSITVDTWEIYDSDSKMATLDKQGSSKITIAGGSESSADASLSELKISPGTLTPAFSSDVTEYTALVGGSTDKIAISAQPTDSSAKVVITGNAELQLGENTISCKVTAGDGSTVKDYTIVVTKQEGEVEDTSSGVSTTGDGVTIGGTSYDIAAEFDDSLLPQGFEKSSYTFGDKEAAVALDSTRNIMLVYLIAADGSGDFYVYDATSDQWSPYVELNTTAKNITIVPLDGSTVLPEGFKETTLDLNGKKVQGWVWASDSEQSYCVVFGMNSEGEKNFYRYDMKEKTVQRYFEDPAIDTGVSMDEYNAAVDKAESLEGTDAIKNIIIAALGVLCVILIILLIILKAAGGKKDKPTPKAKKARKAYDEYDDEEVDVRPVRVSKSDEEDDLDIESVPSDALDDNLDGSEEEEYLRGEESLSEEELKEQEELSKIKQESQKHLASEMAKEEADDGDDDFETIDI